jgi:hypothetical protein
MEKKKNEWESNDEEEYKRGITVMPEQPEDIFDDLDEISIHLTEDNRDEDQVDHGIGKILYLHKNR